MYDKLNAILRSKMAVWGIAIGAILLFCLTATLAFGMHKKDNRPTTATKLPLVPQRVDGLQVQDEPAATHVASGQLQGVSNNGAISQPAGSASSVPSADIDGGIAATQVQSTTTATIGPASTSLSTSLQPSADLDGSDNTGTNVQASLNALGANVNLQAKLP